MKKLKIKIKKMNSEAKIPIMAYDWAAGFDFFSLHDAELSPGETKIIQTGIAMEIPSGKCLQSWDRSGMGVKGIHRFAGLVDPDYRGEIKIVLFNSTKNKIQIKKYDKIAQGLIIDYYTPEFELSENLSKTLREENWKSSSGK